MAAPTENKHVEKGSEEIVPLQPLQMSEILQKLIGENKQRFTQFTPVGGIPAPPRSPEEERVSAFFESCAFKTTLSCVAGMIFR